MIECDGEILVDDGPVRRVVLDLEMAVGEAQPVERLCGAGHRLDGGPHDRGESAGAVARSGPRRQGNWGCARIAGDRKRERAVLGDMQAQVEPVELEPAHPDARHRRRERIKAHLAARGEKDRSSAGVSHRETLEAQTDAPRVVHHVSGTESDGVAVAYPLLKRGLDLVVHADQPDWASGEHRGQHEPAEDEQGRDELHRPQANVGEPATADEAPARWQARTLAVRRQAAHGGPGAGPRRQAKPVEQ